MTRLENGKTGRGKVPINNKINYIFHYIMVLAFYSPWRYLLYVNLHGWPVNPFIA